MPGVSVLARVEASTDAMSLSSHGGLLVLRLEEEHLALAFRCVLLILFDIKGSIP